MLYAGSVYSSKIFQIFLFIYFVDTHKAGSTATAHTGQRTYKIVQRITNRIQKKSFLYIHSRIRTTTHSVKYLHLLLGFFFGKSKLILFQLFSQTFPYAHRSPIGFIENKMDLTRFSVSQAVCFINYFFLFVFFFWDFFQ